MNKELKPCPFCGGETKLISDLSEMLNYVLCMDCYCRTQVFTTKARAIKAWNTRKPIDEIVAQLEIEKRFIRTQITPRGGKIFYESFIRGLNKAIEIVKGGAE